MIRKTTIFAAFCLMFCAWSRADDNIPLDQLSESCREVIGLNDTIKARQAKLDELNSQLWEIRNKWLDTCDRTLSSPECDDTGTREKRINELIALTDREFEADILAELKEALNNPTKTSLNVPITAIQNKPAPGTTRQQPTDNTGAQAGNVAPSDEQGKGSVTQPNPPVGGNTGGGTPYGPSQQEQGGGGTTSGVSQQEPDGGGTNSGASQPITIVPNISEKNYSAKKAIITEREKTQTNQNNE